MTADVKLMTAEDLLRLPDDGKRHELVQGELRTMSPAGFRHGVVAMAIGGHLADHVRRNHLGVVCAAEAGFVLTRNPDTVRAPDAAFVRQERNLDERGFFPGAPDLAIEVISPSDSYSQVVEKVRDYLSAGTARVIVVDPGAQAVFVHTSTNIARLSIDDTLDGGDDVPGWKLPLRELFE